MAYTIFEGYRFYDDGRVYLGERRVKPWLRNGYPTITTRSGKVYVHRVLAETRVCGYKEGYVVDHIDRDKENNNISNLRWVSLSDNRSNSKTYKPHKRIPDVVLDIMANLKTEFGLNNQEISDLTGYPRKTISKAMLRVGL